MLPIRPPGSFDVPISHAGRIGRLEARNRARPSERPKLQRGHIDLGVAGPVIVGETSDWPAPWNLVTTDVYATLRTAGSSSTTGELLLNGGATPVLTVTMLSGVTELALAFAIEMGADADKLRLETTAAGAGAVGFNVQVRYRY